MHGGTVIAMRSRDAVCVATDMRLGQDQRNNIATNVSKVILHRYFVIQIM